MHLYQKQQKVATAYTIGDILANLATGGKYSGVIDTLANVSFQFQTLRYSREVEAAADHKGAITCAQAGSNRERWQVPSAASAPNSFSTPYHSVAQWAGTCSDGIG